MRDVSKCFFVGVFSLSVGAVANAAALKTLQPTQTLSYPPNFYSETELEFGYDMEMSGDELIITAADTANARNAGVFIYRRHGNGRWHFETQLHPPTGTFRAFASIQGDTAVVSGTVEAEQVNFVYRHTKHGWVHTQTIAQPGSFDVALGSGYLVVSNPSANDAVGAAYTFDQTYVGNYAPGVTLTPSDASIGPGWLFGATVEARGDSLVAFAPGGELLYPYRRIDGTWQAEGEIPFSNSSVYSSNGTDIAVGDSSAPSSLRLLHRAGGGWVEYQAISSAPGSDSMRPAALANRDLYAVGFDSATSGFHTYWYRLNNGTWTLAAELLNGSASVRPSINSVAHVQAAASENVAALRVASHTDDPSLEGQVLIYTVNAK